MADPARPRLLRSLAAAPLRSDNPGPVPFGVSQGDLVFSPDGQILASVSGSDQVTVWNVARPARATRIATLARPRDYFAALAFSPRGNLLAGRLGALSDLTTIFRNVSDAQPILAPGDRIVADGSLTGGEVHLWTLP